MVRRTAQRAAIRRVLEDANRPLGPPEILTAAQSEVPQLGLTTVYRALNALVDDGWLIPVKLPGESTRYELAGKDQHYFFRCDLCQSVYDVPGTHADLEALVPSGFVVERHELLFFGTCPGCAGAGQRPRRKPAAGKGRPRKGQKRKEAEASG